MAADVDAADAAAAEPYGPLLRLKSAIVDRDRQFADSQARRHRVLSITTWMAAAVCASFAVIEVMTTRLWPIAGFNVVAALIFALVPLLYRFGELMAPLTLVGIADVFMIVVGWTVGTHTGVAFFFVMSGLVAVMVLGTEHIVTASLVVTSSAALIITINYVRPVRTRAQPVWAMDLGFAISAVAACGMVMATVWYTQREMDGAKRAIELEHERSEALLTNILPTTIAARLKDPTTTIIADKYDEASVLFADIAGFTERASRTTPEELVTLLNRVNGEFDRLVERHGLEKVKTTGDSYMAVSGVPQPRPNHLEALACLALDLADASNRLTDHIWQKVPIRIGLSVGPMVAGVVGTSRFFYDVWGDAVNVASRMESTGVEGRIQVPLDVYERLKGEFVFEERGDVVVKGKGVLRTWFLVGRRASDAVGQPSRQPAVQGEGQ
ncbi:adenylate cyclase [Mycobacterium sp. IS-836]|nr:adenylate/guanylate cyclase domain-containing protein [Mycobacterium sp. IS-836]OMC50904.1 adenylate cyclase [Mycobacterium sp. IS-836]